MLFLYYIINIKRPGVAQTARFTSEVLLPTQAHYPSTEHAERFCLLCFQPRPLLTSLSARWPELPPKSPCRTRPWQGWTINAAIVEFAVDAPMLH